MKQRISVAFATMCILGSIPPVQAQTLQVIPIQELRQQPTGLAIRGEVQSIIGNEFILDDGTGQIIVDAGPRWWHQIELQPGENVTVIGEYDDYDFDAFSITRENGSAIQIRDGSGPPPWAGGRKK